VTSLDLDDDASFDDKSTGVSGLFLVCRLMGGAFVFGALTQELGEYIESRKGAGSTYDILSWLKSRVLLFGLDHSLTGSSFRFVSL
jgi:hypothetical protein